jgi:hypothetical protein
LRGRGKLALRPDLLLRRCSLITGGTALYDRETGPGDLAGHW